jgi:hypothetical protein
MNERKEEKNGNKLIRNLHSSAHRNFAFKGRKEEENFHAKKFVSQM